MTPTFARSIRSALLLCFALLIAPTAAVATEKSSAYDFTLPGIDGAPLTLDRYRGRPILLVNTASRCGFTGQYKGLQTLWSRYREKGLVVIGAPSDDFRQELDSAKAVKEFCEVTFGIDFPMSDIVSVRGAGAHPLFAWAAKESRAPSWNFNKYLIGANGDVLRHYPSSATPERIAKDVEAALAAAKAE